MYSGEVVTVGKKFAVYLRGYAGDQEQPPMRDYKRAEFNTYDEAIKFIENRGELTTYIDMTVIPPKRHHIRK